MQMTFTKPFLAAPQHRSPCSIHPSFILLDLFGPHAVFALLGNVKVHLVWKTREPVIAATGVPIQPTTTFTECPKDLDVLFVPGGLEGGTALMNDTEVVDFLHDRGQRARYVTSVCTGSLLLGAAGLLRGYRATSHWTVRELLPLFGADPVVQRVVEDRNRITAGGVTAGIDFGLQVAARLRSEQYAQMLQLMLEYDPQPPFHAGSPEGAGRKAHQSCAEHALPRGRGRAQSRARSPEAVAGVNAIAITAETTCLPRRRESCLP